MIDLYLKGGALMHPILVASVVALATAIERGLVEAFQQVAEMEARVSPALLASGIWAALITTVGGLFVAIPTLIVHHYFQRKVSHLAFQIEHYGSELLLLMKKEARRAPAAEWAMGGSRCSD